MSTPVVMPQMGESIAEGTIVRWIKKVGDSVDRDEPLFEISTDKVDAEIPSPAAGVLMAIAVKEGETVPGQQRRRHDWRRRENGCLRCREAPKVPEVQAARCQREQAVGAGGRNAGRDCRRASIAVDDERRTCSTCTRRHLRHPQAPEAPAGT